MALENLTPSNRLEAILDGGDVTPSNRREYFIQKAMSAGGVSDLPEYTSADKGKVLTIGDASPVETEVVVFAEQTVEFSRGSGTPVSSVSFDTFADGSTGTLKIDGVEYALSWYSNGFNGDSNTPVVRWYSGDDVWGINGSRDVDITDGNHTVSFTATASVPSVEPKWENVFPPLPTANGNYILTINNGIASWTEQSP